MLDWDSPGMAMLPRVEVSFKGELVGSAVLAWLPYVLPDTAPEGLRGDSIVPGTLLVDDPSSENDTPTAEGL
jgi:hypothetical protein